MRRWPGGYTGCRILRRSSYGYIGIAWVVTALVHLALMTWIMARMYEWCGNPRRNALLFPIGGTLLLLIFLKALKMCVTQESRMARHRLFPHHGHATRHWSPSRSGQRFAELEILMMLYWLAATRSGDAVGSALRCAVAANRLKTALPTGNSL